MTSAFVGYPEYPQFWLSANDFWEQRTDNWIPENWSIGSGRPLPLGRLVFDLPGLKGAAFNIRQRFSDATTIVEYVLNGKPALTLKALVCATENLLLCSFEAHTPLEITALFCFPGEKGRGVEVQGEYRRQWSKAYLRNPPNEYMQDNERVMHGYRHVTGNVDQDTKLAFAGCFIGSNGPTVSLGEGQSAQYVLALASGEKTILPEKVTIARADTFTPEDASMMGALHRAWWEHFWDVSEVEIEDPLIEQRYYLSQYVIASMSRDPKFPPSLFGVNTWDYPCWNANYKINYNHQAPYWALYASGHYEQADPHDAPYLALESQGRQIAQKISGHGGILMPGGLGPKGMVSESMVFHMKSMGAFAVTNMAMRWYTSYDKAYGMKIYAYVRGIVDYWEQDLEFDGTYYHTVNDHAHEMWTEVDTRDTQASLGFVRCALKLILDLSAELAIPEEKKDTWKNILEHIAPYPVKQASEITKLWSLPENLRLTDIYPPEFLKGKEIFLLHGKGEEYSFNCGASLHQVYSSGEVGISSDPHLLEIARNTLELRIAQEEHYDDWGFEKHRKDGRNLFGRNACWNDSNHSCMFFLIAVRIGWDTEKIWQALRSRIINLGLPNGYIKDNPHGIENLSTVPNTVQEMMLQSHEGVLRVFQRWPKQAQPNAAFRDLRAYGAFKVSGRLVNGTVRDVTITSEKGKDCSFEVFSDHPTVTCEGTEIAFEKKEKVITFKTRQSMTYKLG
jgi:hypothetical protein